MHADIQRNIAAALASRHSRIGEVDRFERSWKFLAKSVDSLIGEADAAAAQFRSRGAPTPDELEIAADLDAALSVAALREVRRAIFEQDENVTAIRNRIHRDTVNLGVIGQTQSGKSTFLRTITNIGTDVIPKADDLDPTTSARSRFRNDPERAEAVITLLTEKEFLDEVVAPLHLGAGYSEPPPSTLRGFADFQYQLRMARSAEGRAPVPGPGEQSHLDRLLKAQKSLPSYERYLGGGSLPITDLADLRRFVAYPAENSVDRPYHAVRDVRVFCVFPEVDVKDLQLVDLPGAGEAGLAIDRRFLYDLKNEVDVLLHLTRPRSGVTFFNSDKNIGILKIADEARMGVNRGDFTCLVINEDAVKGTAPEIANVKAKAREIAVDNDYLLVSGDVSEPEQAREKILGPVLEKLAERLVHMDAAAAAEVTRGAAAAAEAVKTAATHLTSSSGRWQVLLPSEDDILRIRSKELRNAIAEDLQDLAARYDQDARDGIPVPELERGITAARRRLEKWADSQFAGPGRDEWLSRLKRDRAGDPGETPDDWCTVVRQQIRREFSQVDGSLDGATARLHREIAKILRSSLPLGGLVPEGDQPFRVLLKTTRESGFRRLQTALDQLILFHAEYRNVAIRVGGPVVAQITYEHALSAGGALSDPADREMVKKALGEGGAKIAGAMTGPHAKIAVPLIAAETALKVAPAVADIVWEARLTDRSPEGFANALSDAFSRAVDLIAKRMREEACRLTATLAAVVTQFYDDLCRTPNVEWEYARLCSPICHELWPDAFDPGATRLASGLSRLVAQATATADAAREVVAAAADLGVGR